MSRLPRVFCSEPASIGQTLVLQDAQAHHLINVLRLCLNDRVCLFTNEKEFAAKVSQIEKDKIYLSILEEGKVNQSTPWKLSLAQAIPKSQKMDWIVEKATELGVAAIYPLWTEHVVKKTERLDRWQKIALSASQQSGRLDVPKIWPVQDGSEFLAHSREFDLKLIASLADFPRQSLDVVIQEARSCACVILAIGPEGDFSSTEVKEALDQGWKAVNLGPLVLRSETAAIAGLAILNHELRKKLNANSDSGISKDVLK